jgi:hypothetical protein
MTDDSHIHSTADIDQLDTISSLQAVLGSAVDISEYEYSMLV